MQTPGDHVEFAKVAELRVDGRTLAGSEWKLQNWGSCEPRRIDSDLVAEEWELAESPLASSQTVDIVVLGEICAGTEAETQIATTEADETADSVIITVWTTFPKVEGNCAGLGIMIPATINLVDPVGGREILDGGIVPPRKPGR